MSVYQYKSLDDTIAAISTSLGQAGIGIVRLSGPKAIEIADQMFLGKNNKWPPSTYKSFSVHYGWAIQNGKMLDEVLLTVMRAPNSYTKQDVVEISSHGGVVSLKAILNVALELGARHSEPGEFTKRAFLNGRIDLAQAEAVLDIISAKTEAFLKVSTHQLKGELSIELETIRGELMGVYLEIEAALNFPEDDISPQNRQQLIERLKKSFSSVEKLLATSNHGRILKDGIKVVLCGKANVGKSSILNVLLKTPRAIVSDIAGTTRDTIEESAQIKGIPFQLVDTAGIIEPRDLIEEEAIKRSHLFIKGADLVLFVFDANEPLTIKDDQLIELVKNQNVLIVFNKMDLPSKIDEVKIKTIFPSSKVVKISAINKTAIDELENAIVESVMHDKRIDTDGLLVSNIRHIEALRQANDNISSAIKLLTDKASLEIPSEDIKIAVNHLDSITGRNIDVDLIDRIFSEFCIGK